MPHSAEPNPSKPMTRKGATALLGLLLSGAALGQADCSLLTIENVYYAAFDLNAFEVDVMNSGAFGFNSPAFELLDEDGASLAQETTYWFGVSQGSQRHNLEMIDGAMLPASPFTGTLVLHYVTMDGNETCSLPLKQVELCPPPPCVGLQPYVWDHGNSGEITMEWTISDADNMVVGEGVLFIDTAGFAFAIDSSCLPPGEYVLTLAGDVPDEAQLEYGLRRDYLVQNSIAVVFTPGAVNELPFSFFGPCADNTNGLVEQPGPELQLVVRDGVLQVMGPNDAPLGRMIILDLAGKVIARAQAGGSRTRVDLRFANAGIYVVWLEEYGMQQRFYLAE